MQVASRQEGDSHGAGTEGLRRTQQQAPCSTHPRYLHSRGPHRAEGQVLTELHLQHEARWGQEQGCRCSPSTPPAP